MLSLNHTFIHYLMYHRKGFYGKWKENLTQDASGFSMFEMNDTMFLTYSRKFSNFGKAYFITFFLDKEAIEKILLTANAKTLHQFSAVLYNDILYAYSGNEDLSEILARTIDKSSPQNQMIDHYFISRQNSEIEGISYYTINNKSEVLQLTTTVSVVLGICMVVCLFVGITYAILISRINFMPMERLMNRIAVPGDIDYSNEFDYIYQRFERIMEENKSSFEQLQKQQRLIETSLITSILSAEPRSQTYITNLAQKYGFSFEGNYFSCFVIELDDFWEHTVVSSCTSKIEQVFCQDFGTGINMLSGIYSEKYCYIFNYDIEPERITKQLQDIITEFSDTIPHLSSAMGNAYYSSSEIVISYLEAVYMLERYDDSFMLYGDYESGNSCGQKLFRQFQLMITARDYKKASDLVDELYCNYVVTSDAALSSLRNCSVLNQIYDVISIESENSIQEKRNTELLYSSENLQICKNNIKTILGKMFGVESPKKDNMIAEQTKEILERDYADSMLTLSLVAEELNVSLPYVSRMFKQHFQQGALEYLNKYRIQKAKLLLADKSMNIKSIAISVGFNSDITFIRVFKKYENITPGKYLKDTPLTKN